MYAETHEKFIMSKIRAGSSIVGLYPPSSETDKEMEEWMAKNVEVRALSEMCGRDRSHLRELPSDR